MLLHSGSPLKPHQSSHDIRRQNHRHLQALRAKFLQLRRKFGRQHEKIKVSNDLLELAAEKGCAVFLVNAAGVFTSWNKGIEHFTGYACGELIGRSLLKLYTPDTLSEGALIEVLAKAQRDGVAELQAELRNKKGAARWVNIVFRRQNSEDGRLKGFAVLNFDLSTLKKTEEMLRRQAAKLRSVVDNVVDAIITIDERGTIESWNPAAEKIFGYEPADVIGHNVKVLMPEPYHSEHDGYLRNYLRTGQAKIIGIGREVIGQRKDGSTFPMDLAVSEVHFEDKRFFTGIVRDITERKQAIDELLSAKENAEAANRAKSSFLANMSHEIRTPLNAVMGFSELLAEPELSPGDRDRYLAVIHRNGDLLSNIINDILDLSKVEAGKLSLEKSEARLEEILSDTQTILAVQAKDKGVEFGVEVAPSVPKTFVTDVLRLRQVLVNVIGNAIKFTNTGSVKVKVDLEKTPHGERLTFTVSDTGPGIALDQVPRLFAPFMQADASLTRRYGGTGLGLVLAKRLAKLLGGDVFLVRTELGKGSTFKISIDPGPPRANAGTYKNSAPKAEKAKKRIRLDGVHVLVADDSPDNQFLVEHILHLSGAEVDLAANGEEALKAVQRHPYDVLLMDLQMPVMDGYEATSRLRKIGYQGQVVALTAHSLKEDRDRCLRSGFNGYLAKPINRDDLLETVAASAHRTIH